MLAAAGILVGLVVTLVLSSRTRVPMGLAFLLGATVMAFMAGMGPVGAAGAMGSLLVAGSTWVFALLVTLVFVLSTVMRLAGSMDVLVQAAGGLIRNRRVRVASLPALVGLLPMPGGAVVSAPLVESAGHGIDITACDKNVINYWFRHVWEVCWPLYPPMLLAASFMEDSIAALCLTLSPLAVLLVIGGYVFLLRRVPLVVEEVRVVPPAKRDLALALLPLFIVIVGMPLCGRIWDGVLPANLAGQIGLGTALLVGLVVTLAVHGVRHLPVALKEPKVWMLLGLALGVKVFGGMVAETGAAVSFAGLVRDGGLPPIIAIVTLPLFVGLVSGATMAVVTVSFPVVVSLVREGASVGAEALLPSLALAYAMGFIGYMLSPVHMCLVLSSRFFGEPVTTAYGRLVPPLGLFLLGAVALYVGLTAAA